MYYLETSAIRPLLKKIETTDLKYEVCTSVLVLLELISGFKSIEDLRTRIGLAQRGIDSQMVIDFEPAENKLIASFQGLVPMPSFEKNTTDLIKILISTTDIGQKLNDQISEFGLTEFWEMIMTYDKTTTKQIALTLQNSVSLVRQRDQIRHINWDNIESNVLSWARSFSQDSKINPKGIGEDVLRQSFDGTSNLYLMANNYYLQLLLDGRTAGRNDYLDLQHFAYLSSNSNVMVSDDQLMLLVGQTVCSRRIMNSNDVTKIIDAD